jgi:hypothetical protein
MKRTSIIILTILAASIVEPAFGDVQSVRLMPGAIEQSPCRVKIALTNDALQFGFSFRTRKETNAVYSSILRIYDGDRLVTLCPVAQSRDGDLVRSEFTVGIRNLSDSKFLFTENRRIQGTESTSPTQYWFFLRDFVETTKP